MNKIYLKRCLWLLCLVLPACTGEAKIDPSRTDSSSEPATPPLKMMDEAQRQLLWEIEHHGNVLSQLGFADLAKALKKDDASALMGILASDFKGEWPAQPEEVSIQTDLLHVVRQSADDKPPLQLDAKAFAAKLLDIPRFCKHSIAGVKLSLMKLRPTREANFNAPWEGTAQLRVWGQKEAGKPAEAIVYLRYRTVRPTKEAMESGRWLLTCAVTQSQLGWSEHYLLREATAERGLETRRLHDNWSMNQMLVATGGAFVCDFDRDGRLDVLITDVNGYYLYKGLAEGKFENVTAAVGLPEIISQATSLALVASWVDLDGDGWEDLILGSYIFRNLDGKRFQNVSPLSNLNFSPHASGVAVADFDGDGRMDLYVFQSGVGKADSWLEGKAGTGVSNRLWHNKGNWRFEDVTASSGTGGDERSTFTALWLDANNDGRPDLYVPNEFGDGVLYINRGNGTFRPSSLSAQACDFGTMGATCGDVNNDGNIDLYCANMYSKAGTRVMGNVRDGTYPEKVMAKMRTFVKGSELHLNRGDAHFEQKGRAWQVADAGWAYGPALVDLDNDGWLDIYATCGYQSHARGKPDG